MHRPKGCPGLVTIKFMSSALVGIVGTLLGAVIGFITSEIQERNRWKRSLDVRWDETRRALYADYISSANKNLSRVTWAARHRERATESAPFELPTDFHLIGDLDNAPMHESIQLICGKEVAAAAHRLLRALWDTKTHVLNGDVRSDIKLQTLIDEFVACRQDFIDAARTELGIEKHKL